jgi:hypothetical protein
MTSSNTGFQQTNLGITNRELGRVHCHSDPTGARCQIVAGQCSLPPLI